MYETAYSQVVDALHGVAQAIKPLPLAAKASVVEDANEAVAEFGLRLELVTVADWEESAVYDPYHVENRWYGSGCEWEASDEQW